MPLYELPVGASFDDSIKDQTKFTLTGHSVTTPHLVIFDRKVPTSVGAVPSYRIRVIKGEEDEDGIPLSTKPIIDTNIRWDQGATASSVKGLLAYLGAVLSDTDFQDDVVDAQRLPRDVASA
jgi:hypothetical protein